MLLLGKKILMLAHLGKTPIRCVTKQTMAIYQSSHLKIVFSKTELNFFLKRKLPKSIYLFIDLDSPLHPIWLVPIWYHFDSV